MANINMLKKSGMLGYLLLFSLILGGLRDGWFVFPFGVLLLVILFLCCFSYSQDAIVGTLKFMVFVVFLTLLLQTSKEEKDVVFELIPYLGMLVLVLSALLSLLPYFHNIIINKAGRLSGTFGYANTFSMLLFVSLVIFMEFTSSDSKNTFNNSMGYLLLGFGILWTGSRSTIILTVIYLLLHMFLGKNKNIVMYLIFLFFVLAIVLYFFFTGNTSGFGRIFSVFSNSSTLVGREIYNIDGFEQLVRHPFGMGYLGWFFEQGAVQSAPYVTKVVHNSFLQIGLDFGIVPMILAIVAAVFMVRYSKTEYRLALIFVMVHFAFDLDSEFLGYMFIILLFIDWDRIQLVKAEPNFRFVGILSTTLIGILFVWQSLFWILAGTNNSKLALRLSPDNVLVENAYMVGIKDIDEASLHAKNIKRIVPNFGVPYDILAMKYFKDGDYLKMSEEGLLACKYQKYDMEVFDHYVLMQEQALVSSDDESVRDKILKDLQSGVDYLYEVKDSTNPLSYKTVDAPSFVLSYNTKSILDKYGIEHQ